MKSLSGKENHLTRFTGATQPKLNLTFLLKSAFNGSTPSTKGPEYEEKVSLSQTAQQNKRRRFGGFSNQVTHPL